MLYATSVYVLLPNFAPLGFVYRWSSWGCLFACLIMNEYGRSLPFFVLFVIINIHLLITSYIMNAHSCSLPLCVLFVIINTSYVDYKLNYECT